MRFPSYTTKFSGNDDKGNRIDIDITITYENNLKVELFVNDKKEKSNQIPLDFILNYEPIIKKVFEKIYEWSEEDVKT